MEIISEKYLKAKKKHFCEFCGKAITPGTLYFDQFNKDCGEVYHWKSCVDCEFLFRQIYDYIDPYDGTLDADGFHEGLCDFGQQFICPNCEHYKDIGDENDKPGRYMECELDNCVECECYDKIIDCLKLNSLIYERRYPDKPKSNFWNPCEWKLLKRTKPFNYNAAGRLIDETLD